MIDKRASAADAGTAPKRTAWLTVHGRRPWTQVRALLNGCTCTWADLDGFHAEGPPASAPVATHLWAWATGRLLRVRIDGNDAITAELNLNDPGHSEPVTVTEREASGWPSGEGRVSAAPQWRDRTIHIYQVTGIMPLEFALLSEASSSA
jgi:hypothetical protein